MVSNNCPKRPNFLFREMQLQGKVEERNQKYNILLWFLQKLHKISSFWQSFGIVE